MAGKSSALDPRGRARARRTIAVLSFLVLVLVLVLGLGATGCSGGGERQADPVAAKKAYMQGQEAAKKGEHKEAIEYYTEAIQEDPEYSDAYFQRAWMYLQCRHMPEPPHPTRELIDLAFVDYSLAIKYNPMFGDAYFSRAMLWASRANYKQAVEDLLVAARYKPHDPEPELLLGELYEHKFEDKGLEAMKHYEKYAQLGGTNELVREKVKIWKQFKAASEQPKKEPTADDEKKAEQLHQQFLVLYKEGKHEEAYKPIEELVTKYGHTKYFKSNQAALQALYNVLKDKFSKPK